MNSARGEENLFAQVPLPEQGQISGASTALGSLMSVFGPLWAGAIYD